MRGGQSDSVKLKDPADNKPSEQLQGKQVDTNITEEKTRGKDEETYVLLARLGYLVRPVHRDGLPIAGNTAAAMKYPSLKMLLYFQLVVTLVGMMYAVSL
ncbi:hypothetical protein BDV06DRAFT_218558 [Aspergillus oleicola]